MSERNWAFRRLRCRRRAEVNLVIRFAALASCAGVALAACAISPPDRTVGAGSARPAPIQAAKPACPRGRLLPQGEAVYVEYVDFLELGGRTYVAGLGPQVTIDASGLCPLIAHIRCSLSASDDHRHAGIGVVDRSAAFLPAGAAEYEVRGYSPDCRLAGYWAGRLHVYLAQRDVHGHSAPRPCALSPQADTHN